MRKDIPYICRLTCCVLLSTWWCCLLYTLQAKLAPGLTGMHASILNHYAYLKLDCDAHLLTRW